MKIEWVLWEDDGEREGEWVQGFFGLGFVWDERDERRQGCGGRGKLLGLGFV